MPSSEELLKLVDMAYEMQLDFILIDSLLQPLRTSIRQ